MDIYLLNVIRAARLAQPIMAAQGTGSIVNISTFAAFKPDADVPTSAVFRAGLAAFTTLFSTQHAASGVRMNNVLPGFVDSISETPERVERIPIGPYARSASSPRPLLQDPSSPGKPMPPRSPGRKRGRSRVTGSWRDSTVHRPAVRRRFTPTPDTDH